MRLTERQQQLAEAVARGLSDKEISAELGIGEQTVHNHLTAIYRLLDIHSRTSLAVWILTGWLPNRDAQESVEAPRPAHHGRRSEFEKLGELEIFVA